jgi:hypothetical protein
MRRVLVLSLVVLLSLIGTAQAAFVDGFENWTNPVIAKDWNTSLHGSVWGGVWNQIYYSGQGVSCGGNGTNFKSVYRDILVTPGLTYRATVEAMSNSTNVQGIRDGSYVRLWIQFDEENGNLLAPHGATGTSLSDRFFSEMRAEGTAPAGTHHARVILQVMGGTGGGTVFTNFNFYRVDSATSATRVSGPDFIRNTEWLGGSNVQQLWTAFSSGGGPGDYVLTPTSGSSQGISIGGSAGSYREIYRTFNIASFRSPGATTNQASVYVTSNATNLSGVKDPSQVEMHMQFFDDIGRLVSGGSSVNGAQFGVNSQDSVKMTVEAPTPSGATKITVILRVLGGTGGGAVFDDFSLATM